MKLFGNYIYFTEEQKHQAANADLEQFLLCRGERLIRSGKDRRLESDHSITIRGSEWYDHSAQVGGCAISFVQKHYGLGYAEAVSALLGTEHGAKYPDADIEPDGSKEFILPSANRDMRHVFAYLVNSRGIDSAIVSVLPSSKRTMARKAVR